MTLENYSVWAGGDWLEIPIESNDLDIWVEPRSDISTLWVGDRPCAVFSTLGNDLCLGHTEPVGAVILVSGYDGRWMTGVGCIDPNRGIAITLSRNKLVGGIVEVVMVKVL